MSFKQSIALVLAGGSVVAVGIAGFAAGRGSTGESSALVPAFQPEEMNEEMMKQMIAEQGKLAPQHKQFLPMVGTFDCEMHFMMAPGAEPDVSHGTSVNTLILGGRFMQTDFTGDIQMFGDKVDFTGLGLLGFDKIKGEFVSAWTDTMTTGLQVSTGKPSKDGKVITVEGVAQSAMGEAPMKTVYDIESNDKYTMVFYQGMPGMDEMMKIGWITCTRKEH